MKGPLARPVVPLAGLDACRPKVLSGFGITTCINIIVMRRFHSIQFGSRVQRAFGRPGSDLLSRVLRRSTISAGAFHGRVRNGIGCSRSAITTRSAKRTLFEKLFFVPRRRLLRLASGRKPASATARRRFSGALAERPAEGRYDA